MSWGTEEVPKDSGTHYPLTHEREPKGMTVWVKVRARASNIGSERRTEICVTAIGEPGGAALACGVS